MGKPYRIFGYARTSTDEQVISIENQAELAEKRGHLLEGSDDGARWVSCFFEHASGSKIKWKNRPEFMALLDEIEDGDTLVVWRLSRIERHPFRLVSALDYLMDRNIRVIALEMEMGRHGVGGELDLSSAMGRSMVLMLTIANDLWLEAMREDVSSALRRLVKQGFHFSKHPPIGKRFERVNLPPGVFTRRNHRTWRTRALWDQEQCDYVREVWVRHRLFNQSLNTIAMDFHRRNIVTSIGHPWTTMYTPPLHKTFRKVTYQRAPYPILERYHEAVKLVDDLMKKGELPFELRIDEATIQEVAARTMAALDPAKGDHE